MTDEVNEEGEEPQAAEGGRTVIGTNVYWRNVVVPTSRLQRESRKVGVGAATVKDGSGDVTGIPWITAGEGEQGWLRH